MIPLFRATTVSNNDAFVALTRTNVPDPPELYVYRLDPQSRWGLVRRIAGADPGVWTLALSDGTVLVEDQAANDTSDMHVVAYPPDSDIPREVWRESSAMAVHFGSGQLLVGPLEASGPGVVSE